MATASQWFGQAGGYLIARLWNAQDMRVILLNASYVPNVDTHLRYSDVSTYELPAAGGYAVGGKSLATKTIAYDAAAHEYNLGAADLSWGPGATFQTRYGIILEWDTTDKFLWGLLDFGTLEDVQNGTFTLDWSNYQLSVLKGPPV